MKNSYRKTVLSIVISLLLLLPGCKGEEKKASMPQLPIEGTWSGKLAVGETSLTLEFSFAYTETELTAGMSVPEQNLSDLPANEVSIDANNEITLRFTQIGGIFTGTLTKEGITGTWKQSGSSFPLVLTRKGEDESASKRVQDPASPFPYRSQEITFPGGGDGYSMAGTLTIPAGEGPFPAVVLVNGSGQQNRDSEIFNHRPFLVLADALTRKGIAVLRYDDQGIGGSGGNPQRATTFDFAADAAEALSFLSKQETIDPDRIGIIGHSEGGLIAAILAADADSLNLNQVVLLAGTGLPGSEILVTQNRIVGEAHNFSSQQLKTAEEANRAIYATAVSILPDADKISSIEKELIRYGASKNDAAQQAQSMLIPWMVTFLRTDPAEYLEKITIPVLALNGSLDTQVVAGDNLPAIEAALKQAGNTDYEVKEIEGLNHLFQPAVTGLVNEYGSIEITFSPEVIDLIIGWIESH